MKTKWMCMVLMFTLALNLSACGNSKEDMNSPESGSTIGTFQSQKDNSSENTGNESSDNNTVNPQNGDAGENTADAGGNVQSPAGVGSVNSSAFSGKVSDCYYADDNRIIVAADKLYLYDTQKGESIASVDISLYGLYVQTYSDGYFVVGRGNGDSNNGSLMTSQSSDGINGYLLNRDFNIVDAISFQELLSDDFVLGTADVAISQDGKQIAFGGIRGLYLYDISTKKVSTILPHFVKHFSIEK